MNLDPRIKPVHADPRYEPLLRRMGLATPCPEPHAGVYATDDRHGPKLGNLPITADWRLVMIDFTRAFRQGRTLEAPASLTRCDRRLLDALRALTRAQIEVTIRQSRRGRQPSPAASFGW